MEADAAGSAAPGPPAQIVVSGGGAHNPRILAGLQRLFPDSAVEVLDHNGLDADNKEAFGFAYLGYLNLRRFPGNLPTVTGASGPQILGKLVW